NAGRGEQTHSSTTKRSPAQGGLPELPVSGANEAAAERRAGEPRGARPAPGRSTVRSGRRLVPWPPYTPRRPGASRKRSAAHGPGPDRPPATRPQGTPQSPPSTAAHGAIADSGTGKRLARGRRRLNTAVG